MNAVIACVGAQRRYPERMQGPTDSSRRASEPVWNTRLQPHVADTDRRASTTAKEPWILSARSATSRVNTRASARGKDAGSSVLGWAPRGRRGSNTHTFFSPNPLDEAALGRAHDKGVTTDEVPGGTSLIGNKNGISLVSRGAEQRWDRERIRMARRERVTRAPQAAAKPVTENHGGETSGDHSNAQLAKGALPLDSIWEGEIKARDEQIRILKQQLLALGEHPMEEIVSLEVIGLVQLYQPMPAPNSPALRCNCPAIASAMTCDILPPWDKLWYSLNDRRTTIARSLFLRGCNNEGC